MATRPNTTYAAQTPAEKAELAEQARKAGISMGPEDQPKPGATGHAGPGGVSRIELSLGLDPDAADPVVQAHRAERASETDGTHSYTSEQVGGLTRLKIHAPDSYPHNPDAPPFVFQSEMIEAIQDPRYANDASYRSYIESRIRNTD